MATRSWIVPGVAQHQIDDVTRLRVQLVAGSVEVRSHEAPHVWAEVTELVGNPLEMTVEGGRLTIGYPSIGWEGWVKRLRSYNSSDSAALTIYVPHGTGTSVATASADVTVRHLVEDVTVNTAAGSILLDGCRGAATLRSASSGIVVSGHDGPLRVNAAAGRTSLAGRLPRVEVASMAGDIAVRTDSDTSKVDVSTVSGDMRVALPIGTGVSLSARSVSGAVRLDGTDHRTSGFGATTVEDRTEGGICFLTARSVSGDLDVVREPASLPRAS
ncbi:DUF4097 family beta strand repeat-containing protein [Georgenia deserti]|uniref:DUF4097 domain-containing protein n=1 Tax=Georgenia deserti TaxID=2093781 RepID=A0ABW4L111_9MICO